MAETPIGRFGATVFEEEPGRWALRTPVGIIHADGQKATLEAIALQMDDIRAEMVIRKAAVTALLRQAAAEAASRPRRRWWRRG